MSGSRFVKSPKVSGWVKTVHTYIYRNIARVRNCPGNTIRNIICDQDQGDHDGQVSILGDLFCNTYLCLETFVWSVTPRWFCCRTSVRPIGILNQISIGSFLTQAANFATRNWKLMTRVAESGLPRFVTLAPNWLYFSSSSSLSHTDHAWTMNMTNALQWSLTIAVSLW